MKAIGVLGGTFDPVHIGHLRLAIEAKEQLNLEYVKLMPCSLPPHREPALANPNQRFEMLNSARSGISGLEIDDRELNRAGPSYSIDSLRSLREEFPNTPLCFILGSDAFVKLNEWRNWRDLISFCHIAVASRTGVETKLAPELKQFVDEHKTNQTELLQQNVAGRIIFLEFHELDISSSRIRALCREGKEIRFLVTDKVRELIEDHKLYT